MTTGLTQLVVASSLGSCVPSTAPPYRSRLCVRLAACVFRPDKSSWLGSSRRSARKAPPTVHPRQFPKPRIRLPGDWPRRKRSAPKGRRSCSRDRGQAASRLPRGEQATLIAVGAGTRHRGVGIAFGDVATEMLHRARASVLVARGTSSAEPFRARSSSATTDRQAPAPRCPSRVISPSDSTPGSCRNSGRRRTHPFERS